MYVCICKAVTDHDIRREIEEGVRSLRHLARRLGAATECGRCRRCIVEIIKQANAAADEAAHRPAVTAALPCDQAP